LQDGKTPSLWLSSRFTNAAYSSLLRATAERLDVDSVAAPEVRSSGFLDFDFFGPSSALFEKLACEDLLINNFALQTD
jgi:hypothetical protein